MGNPIITRTFTADPTVVVHQDTVYLFTGHDEAPGFAEGAHLHKRNGWYYLSYGYGTPEKVAYAMSRSIDGPWEFKGILNELAGNCETNRPAMVDFKGKSYFFYHNGGLKDGGSHRRSVCVDYLHYNEDATMQRVIMTTEGVRAVH